MVEVRCPGLPASWLNGWLAAVGAAVLDKRIRLHWTRDAEPLAVLSAKDVDPIEALIQSWPETETLSDLPIAQDWNDAGELQRKVKVEAFIARAKAARGHPFSWTLSSTMTDLCVDKNGEVVHAPFDPAGPGTIKWLHHRLMKIHESLELSTALIRDTLTGDANRVKGNGLGFDQTRLGSLSDKAPIFMDPVVEELAFFGLSILPVRGPGTDKRLDRRADARARQRGWLKTSGSPNVRSFHWPAWREPLDHSGIDAIMDAWKPERKHTWPLISIHAGWRSLQFSPRGSADTTRAFGAERL